MKDIKITLSIIWIAVMLTYLLGDVLQDFHRGYGPRRNRGNQIHPGYIVGNCGSDGYSVS